MEQKFKVTLIRSGINRGKRHRQTLKGLGLTRMWKTVEVVDTNAIRGMIFQVQHLVRVEPLSS